MPAKHLSETALIDRIEAALASGSGKPRGVRVAIGDDAAVLSPVRAPLVWTVDACVEGVHFDVRWLTPDDVGARSFHAAVSDVAAMGARPLAALSSLVVPARVPEAYLLRLVKGQAEASRELECPVIGGNVSRGSELSVTTTVVGYAARPLTRKGARPGDDVWLLGDVGLAAAGLACLQRGRRLRRSRAVAACVRAWRRPRALVELGLRLAGRAHAAIDVSDGLATDAGHVAVQSGVRVVLLESRLESVLRPELVAVAREVGVPALSLALSGGEDYALVATGPARRRPRGARVIGSIERGRGVELVARDGTRRPVAATGFDHFR